MEYKVDSIGPEMVTQVYDSTSRLHGILVIDNTKLGPGKGGIRITRTVNVEEVVELARAMTYKTALANLPFGGAKAAIVADTKRITLKKKEELIRTFAKKIKELCPSRYIAGPDMGTGEEEMKHFADANGDWYSATGKPVDYCTPDGKKCGIPHELGSTGWGVAHATDVASHYAGLPLKKLSVAIEGFGNVGTFAFQYLSDMGAKIVAVSDSKGTLYNTKGINFKQLLRVKEREGSVIKYIPGKILTNAQLFTLPVDILIPSAIPNVITDQNVGEVKAKIIVEGSNIPIEENIEERLHKRGVLVVPDFVANAGGVISSYYEYIGESPEEMMKAVKEKVKQTTEDVLKLSKRRNTTPRQSAIDIAVKRLLG